MKKPAWFFALLLPLFIAFSCKKEALPAPDLALGLAGTYSGTLVIQQDSSVYLDPYELIVIRIENSRLRIEASGAEFAPFEISLEEAGNTQINSTDEQSGVFVAFIQSAGGGWSLNVNHQGFKILYTGERE